MTYVGYNRWGTLGDGTRSERMKDTRLVERALAESWPIPDSLRPRLVKYLAKILTDKTSSPRGNHVRRSRSSRRAGKINLGSDLTVDEVEDVLLNPESNTLISRTSGRPITFGWTLTDRHIAVIWETVCDDPKMIRVRTAYEVKRKGGKHEPP